MLTAETKRRIDACRDILVGKLPLPTDQVELITLALIYKFMDDLDGESIALGGRRSFFTDSLEPHRWRALFTQKISAEQRVALFSEGLDALGNPKRAAHLPGLFRDIFRNAFLKFRDGRILTLFLTEINGFAYSHSEELGNAFEYLLQCMGTQGENGQFRTPRHIIDFMVACLEPRVGERILDPACGTGGFLVSAYKRILARSTTPGSSLPGDRLTHAERQELYASLTGYDITDLMVKLSKVNLFLHGFPDPAIHIYDTLSNDARWHERADLILANPPFMTPKGGVTPHTRFRIAARKAEVLFTDYIAEHLSANGRAGVIVPNGIVATTQNAYVKLRRFLVEEALVAVVSLPAGVFKPYAGVKTSILFLDKRLARERKEILFLKIAADGFDLGDKRSPIQANDLPEAERVVKGWLAGEVGESTVAWKAVEKAALLGNPASGLQAEQFLGNGNSKDAGRIKVRLGDVCDAVLTGPFGSSLHQSDYVSNGIPVINPQNIVNGRIIPDREKTVSEDTRARLREFAVRENDIVIGRRGEMGRCALATGEMDGWLCGTGSFVIRVNSSALPSFVAVMISSTPAKQFLEENAIGVTLKNLNQQVLSDLEIPLPPLEDQRRIVAEIEGYQKVLDGARQILAGYRAQIPELEKWPTMALRELLQEKPKNGYSGRPVQHETKVKVLTLTATTSGKLDITQFKYLDEDIPADAPCRCRRGDIYLQRGNTKELVGTAALFDVDAPEFIYPDLMIRVRADETKILTKFLLYTLQSEPVRQFLMSNATGAAGNMPKINQGIVESIPIPLPPLSEQHRIVSELEAEAGQIEAVRGLIPRFEAKIQRVLDRVWGKEA